MKVGLGGAVSKPFIEGGIILLGRAVWFWFAMNLDLLELANCSLILHFAAQSLLMPFLLSIFYNNYISLLSFSICWFSSCSSLFTFFAGVLKLSASYFWDWSNSFRVKLVYNILEVASSNNLIGDILLFLLWLLVFYGWMVRCLERVFARALDSNFLLIDSSNSSMVLISSTMVELHLSCYSDLKMALMIYY